jgi:hydroxymethylbilane synthase
LKPEARAKANVDAHWPSLALQASIGGDERMRQTISPQSLNNPNPMSTATRLRIGTRESPLARWQAKWVALQLESVGVVVELVFIETSGDSSLAPRGTTAEVGLFTKAIQQALLRGQIDVAVHSLKDLPTKGVDGIVLAAVPRRASSRDVLVSREGKKLDQLRPSAVIGTGSLRRQSQLLHRRPDLVIKNIRGNVGTRLAKLERGEYDAIVLAEAGLARLGCEEQITEVFSPSIMMPAIGQGALGIEIRTLDKSTATLVSNLDDPPSHSAVRAERSMLARLRGGCLAPVGAWGRVAEDERLVLDGVVLSPNGRRRLVASGSARMEESEQLGASVAEQLLDEGAADLIAASRIAK